jgi:hypothetical protein
MVTIALTPGQTVETTDPVVQLRLAEGEYQLTLVVVREDGTASQPVTLPLSVLQTPIEETE